MAIASLRPGASLAHKSRAIHSIRAPFGSGFSPQGYVNVRFGPDSWHRIGRIAPKGWPICASCAQFDAVRSDVGVALLSPIRTLQNAPPCGILSTGVRTLSLVADCT